MLVRVQYSYSTVLVVSYSKTRALNALNTRALQYRTVAQHDDGWPVSACDEAPLPSPVPRSLDWLHLLDCPTFCNEPFKTAQPSTWEPTNKDTKIIPYTGLSGFSNAGAVGAQTLNPKP